ncbi:actin-related protein 2/3 complex subunit 5-like [Corticium candelabrum]|uniref:actin-related protein 2/3 complex subunit 5-like n=1 Tax=Corticium candelabrum TaxID=121492 RepID=UPI002E255E34|nr:actin-related protein 2/3 complex subunit 5-like [Corticium candelabrum]
MSKASSSTKFRRVDVDELDEENYRDETDAPEGGDEGASIEKRESEVEGHLKMKNNKEALQAVMHDPPVASRDQKVKDRFFALVMRVLSGFKTSEIDIAAKGLTLDQIDILMKYIYRGFAEPSEKGSALLLQWHEKALAIGGLGCIVRVLTDRKNV